MRVSLSLGCVAHMWGVLVNKGEEQDGMKEENK